MSGPVSTSDVEVGTTPGVPSRHIVLSPDKAGDADALASLLDAPRGSDKVEKLGGLENVCNALGTSTVNGLPDSDDKEARKLKYGPNSREPPEMTPLWKFAWVALQDPTLILLCVAGVLSMIIGLAVEDPKTGWIDGTAILLAVIIVVTVQSVNDWSKERKFMALLAKRNERVVPVVRGGKTMNIDSTELVVGDIVELNTGDQIPGDGVLVDASALQVDESALTGESDEVKKKMDGNSYLISGTTITQGTGRMLVVAVGERSQWGKTLKLLETSDAETDLQMKLEVIATNIGKLGFLVAGITVIVLLIRWGVDEAAGNNDDDDQTWYSAVVEFIIQGITIAVVAVPEGLPLAVTISLMYSLTRMMKDNNFVRHLDKCEVMGNATAICSDKTGTLTTNRMAVKRGYVGGDVFSLEEAGAKLPAWNATVVDLITTGVCLNSTAFLQEGAEGSVDYAGNKTECALLMLARELGVDYAQVRKTTQKVHTVPFSSSRKRMSTAIRLQDGSVRLYTKGASEKVLEDCPTCMQMDGSSLPLADSTRGDIEGRIYDFASSGLRTLCLAYKDFKASEWEAALAKGDDLLEKELTCIAIMGIMDPVRDEVPGAVATCVKAGVKVRMVTGDNLTTAINIAERCGIYNPLGGGLAMEGPEFADLAHLAEHSESAKKHFLDQVQKLQVLARSQPKDKHTLVGALQELGEVVAVTGDGTNDAPALKLADVGFAMGIAGTEVAKEAADIIILDDNFKSLVLAVMWGRNVYDAIRKFLQFQLSVNVSAVVVAFIGALTIKESPLTAVQLLWVNLIMDSLGSLALATEAPTPALLDRMPYRKTDPIISLEMWRFILGSSIYQVAVLLCLIYKAFDWLDDIDYPGPTTYFPECGTHCDEYKGQGWKLHHGDYPGRHFTIVFNAFVYLQLFNMINARRLNGERDVLSGMVTNHLFIGILIICACLQIILVEYGGRFIGCASLTSTQWLVCVVIGFGQIIWYQVIMCFPAHLLGHLPFLNIPVDYVETEDHHVQKGALSRMSSSKRSSRGIITTSNDSIAI